MDTDRALAILADSHTRDDDLVGFVVEAGGAPAPWISMSDYLEAWKVVRRHIGRQVLTAHEREQVTRYQSALHSH